MGCRLKTAKDVEQLFPRICRATGDRKKKGFREALCLWL